MPWVRRGQAPALVTETGTLPGDLAQLRRQVPVGRLGQPSEAADPAAAILSNAYLTNQVISLDFGFPPTTLSVVGDNRCHHQMTTSMRQMRGAGLPAGCHR